MNCAEAAVKEMAKFDKTPTDVLWVGEARYVGTTLNSSCAGSWEDFSNSFYGKSSEEHSALWNNHLVIKGDGWWLELTPGEYAGEWFSNWEYREEPIKPKDAKPFPPPRQD